MSKLYRTIVPLRFREKAREYQEYREYKRLRRQEGHVYQCFDTTKSIFVHIPKAGGISIIKSLYGENIGGFGHPTYKRFLKLYGQTQYQEYYKFTFVRNPWDRLYSAYCFLKKGGISHQDKQFSEEVLSEYQSFEAFVMQWLTRENIKSWVHFIPQHLFITNQNGMLVVDFVGRFENFHRDFQKISDHIGIKRTLIHRNKTKDKMLSHYREVYTREMKVKVEQLYKKDIDLFDYKY